MVSPLHSKWKILLRRRNKIKSNRFKKNDSSKSFHKYITMILGIGVFVISIAQWRASVQEGEVSEALRRLEYARSEARFDFKSSSKILQFESVNNFGVVKLPQKISVTPTNGVSSIDLLDSQIKLYIGDRKSNEQCTIFVRGLYLDGDSSINFMDETKIDFRKLIQALDKQGLDVGSSSYTIRIRYTDIFGQSNVKEFEIGYNDPNEVSPTPFSSPILYSGIWSGGRGFYFDEYGDPINSCPKLASQLKAAALATGGKQPNL